MAYPEVPISILILLQDGFHLALLGDSKEVVIQDEVQIVVTPEGGPKTFLFQFLLPAGYVFDNPAAAVSRIDAAPEEGNAFGFPAVGLSSTLLVDSNDLRPGDPAEVYRLQLFMLVKGGPQDGERVGYGIDPTVVNNPYGSIPDGDEESVARG